MSDTDVSREEVRPFLQQLLAEPEFERALTMLDERLQETYDDGFEDGFREVAS